MRKLRIIATLLGFALAFTAAYAAVPDVLECSAEPSVIHATWNQSDPSTTEVTVQVLTDDGEPVKLCGIEVKCESQNTNILHNGSGGAIARGFVDEFGRATFTFQSTGNRRANVGQVDIICRSLQQTSCSTKVDVKAHVPDTVELSACPWTNDPNDNEPDILADGISKVIIAAQLKNDKFDNGTELIPVKKSGVKVKFTSLDTSIVRECVSDKDMDGLDLIVATTDDQGVATAEFCSSGSGTENEGTATIEVEVDGGFGIDKESINITTTRNFGTTTILGQLNMSTIPSQILADGTSTVTACVQLRKTNGLIIKNPPDKVVSFVSHNTSHLIPTVQPDPNNPGYTEADEDGRFPQGGIYTALFKSAGIHDPNSVGNATIEASAEFFQNTHDTVELVGAQYWPSSLNITESPGKVLCDGKSKVKITAQLLDDNGYPVFMEGRLVRFKSKDTEKLVDATDGDALATNFTDKFGKTSAWFRAKDCKLDNFDPGNVTIEVSTISDQVKENATVQVILPKGFKPTGVNAYTDHTLEHRDGVHDNTAGIESHAAPALISADGEKPVYVTAQVCEWTTDVEDRDGDGNKSEEFCNPVKRSGVRIEFKVEDDNIVMNKRDFPGQNDSEDLVDVVYLETDEEGKATAVFRSTGTTPGTNVGCTNIRITAQNGVILDGPTYARVCAVQHEATTPNAVWVWAQPAFITADGSSHTTIRTALYWCTDDNNNNIADVIEFDGGNQTVVQSASSLPTGVSGLKPDDLTGLSGDSNASTYCKPVQLEGAEVKFESSDPQVLDNGLGGYKVITTTDQYGQAKAVFQSTGFDTQHIGKSEIKVFVNNIGEDVTQLNQLFVHTEEKTWPWCAQDPLTGGAAEADTNGDRYISDDELLTYIIKWAAGQVTDIKLLEAVTAWLNQL